jgi:hypothetical protein
MGGKVRDRIHRSFVFCFVAVDDYATALGMKNLDAGPPRLSPSQTPTTRRTSDSGTR